MISEVKNGRSSPPILGIQKNLSLYKNTPPKTCNIGSRETRFFRETLKDDRKSLEAASQLAYSDFVPINSGTGCLVFIHEKQLFGLQQNHGSRGQKRAK